MTNWGELRPTRWIIAAMITHDAYHAGEINHLRSLLDGDDRWRYIQLGFGVARRSQTSMTGDDLRMTDQRRDALLPGWDATDDAAALADAGPRRRVPHAARHVRAEDPRRQRGRPRRPRCGPRRRAAA